MSVKTLQLEVGKTYVRKDNRLCRITQSITKSNGEVVYLGYVINGGTAYVYTSNGQTPYDIEQARLVTEHKKRIHSELAGVLVDEDYDDPTP